MPLPKPKPEESRSEFISRCVINPEIVADFETTQQRLAVCYDLYSNKTVKQSDKEFFDEYISESEKNKIAAEAKEARNVSRYLNREYNKGVEHKLQTLLDDNPICSWDIKIGDTTFDVKTLEHPNGNFLVNEEQHHKKTVDYYAFVLPVKNNNAYIWKYTYEQVSDWNVKHFGYANAYHKKVTYEDN